MEVCTDCRLLPLQLHDMSMIQDMDHERRNLIVYDRVTGTKVLLRASKPAIRNAWLDRANLLIEDAKQMVQCVAGTSHMTREALTCALVSR